MKKWKLVSKKDISPHEWFPLEMRTYELPNGKTVSDFSVSTIADVAMIVAVTPQQKIVLVRQYKPGADEVMLQFPAGRKDTRHKDLLDTAVAELKEEVGILARREQFMHFAKLTGFSTKSTEKVNLYYIQGVNVNTPQELDETEEIEVVLLSSSEMDDYIRTSKIICAQTIAGWTLAKEHFSL